MRAVNSSVFAQMGRENVIFKILPIILLIVLTSMNQLSTERKPLHFVQSSNLKRISGGSICFEDDQRPWPGPYRRYSQTFPGATKQRVRPDFQKSSLCHPCPPMGNILTAMEKEIYDGGRIFLLLLLLHQWPSLEGLLLPQPAFTAQISAWYILCFHLFGLF